VPRGLAHAINNPLTTVIYNVESVLADVEELAARVDPTELAALRDMADRLKDALDGSHRIREIVAGLRAGNAVPAARAAQPADATPRTDRGRILLVDDEEGIGLAVTRMFRKEYDVEVRTSGRAGLEAIEAGDYDAILCDLMIPDLDGVELYNTAIRNRPELASRFVFISGGSFAAGTLEFFNRIQNPVLRKPMSPTELRDVLRQVVASTRRGREG
jgi:CheY-like chemotaxis protein